jgi:PTH2 family peptidyl-tRNA hydrolase
MNTIMSVSYKCVILVRQDIKMSCGKMIAQCGHGIAQTMKGSNKQMIREWMRNGEKIVALKVANLETMDNLKKKANKQKLFAKIIRDAGHTEVEPDTPTVCVIGPDTEERINAITGKLQIV